VTPEREPRDTSIVIVHLLVGFLGLMFVVAGALQVRAWRRLDGEPGFIRAVVAVRAASRFLAGVALGAGAALLSWPLMLAGAISVLIGNVASQMARQKLKRV
jgi:hypothetical protein